MENGDSVSAKAVGEARIVFENKYLFLNSVYFIPCFRQNLMSVSRFCEQLFLVSLNNNAIVISRNGLNICSTHLEYGLYVLRPYTSYSFNTEMFRIANPISNKKQKASPNNETYL